MRKVNLSEIKQEAWQSPGGKYAASFKGISEALGREPSSLDLAKRHPFDLEWNRVPPGKPAFPYHAHSAQWELYLVVSGKGSVRHKDGTTEVVPGDAFVFGPDEPHQMSSSGQEDLVYYVIADNPITSTAKNRVERTAYVLLAQHIPLRNVADTLATTLTWRLAGVVRLSSGHGFQKVATRFSLQDLPQYSARAA
jgi:uncharacterized cupin superfamily protein